MNVLDVASPRPAVPRPTTLGYNVFSVASVATLTYHPVVLPVPIY